MRYPVCVGNFFPRCVKVAMHWIFNCLYAVLLVCALPYWLWKLPQARRYRAGLLERMGLCPRWEKQKRRLWVHCASVGEASIPRNLARVFANAHPHWDVLFSTSTDTGAERLREFYPRSPVFYWPFDFTFCVGACMRRIQPDAVILVELEVWPNFMRACRLKNLPVCIVNGRMSARSVGLLRMLKRLCHGLWEPVRLCCARSAEDARRFREAGLDGERVRDSGSLKYDVLSLRGDPERERRMRELFAIRDDAPVLVAGSTFQGEEAAVCRVFTELRRHEPALRLIVAPRHIERASQAAEALKESGLTVCRKSDLDAERAAASGNEVILVDTIGDLPTCYGLARCVFVGRSLFPPGGGQNMLEPAALGKPVLVGLHTGNFEPEMALLRQREAVIEIEDESQLAEKIQWLLSEPEAACKMGARAQEAVRQAQGATGRTLAALEEMLKEAGVL